MHLTACLVTSFEVHRRRTWAYPCSALGLPASWTRLVVLQRSHTGFRLEERKGSLPRVREVSRLRVGDGVPIQQT